MSIEQEIQSKIAEVDLHRGKSLDWLEKEIRTALKAGRITIRFSAWHYLSDPSLCPDNFYKDDTTRSPANLP